MSDASTAQGAPVKATWDREVNESGEFCRKPSTFRDSVQPGSRFTPESGRYHLYVSLACPWAQRVMITRAMKGLVKHISVDIVDSFLDANGWSMKGTEEGATGDRVNGFKMLREAYVHSRKDFSGAVTVPVLWDTRHRTIVNNESAELVRIFDRQLQTLAEHPEVDLCPRDLEKDIDQLNAWVYSDLNNGVYEAGFAQAQAAYEDAARRVFVALDRLEGILTDRRYLFGTRLTEADVRLFPTLIRFDTVYYSHFKCNLRRVKDYPNLWAYARDLYTRPEFRTTTDFTHIKAHYYCSHRNLNPLGIVPIGPALDLDAPHDRARLG